VVNLLIPELQKRGIYWSDYPVPGGTLRENVHGIAGESLLKPTHPGAKVRWNAPTTTELKPKTSEIVVPVTDVSEQ
jgi:hypothetical protein